ncbi:MAG TPA: response regulator transcription factor [Burkholderiales bacterium]|nr:response regulator transcription factor [Burkholderiales bacterium]
MQELDPKIYIVDDDEAFRDSLRWLLESNGFETELFASAQQFLNCFNSAKPGCVVLDIRMPGMTGLELQETLNKKGVRTPVIFVTGHGDIPMAVNAVKRGAIDFIEKPFNETAMLELIAKALLLDAQWREADSQHAMIHSRLAKLTARELEVMECVIAGKSNKLIAEHLGITVKTVEAHRSKVMDKMEANSVAELVQLVAHERLRNLDHQDRF